MIFNACSPENEKTSFSAIPFAEGDIVFRKGTGAKTQAVIHADSLGTYSHTGIVVMLDSVFKIIHITPGEREKDETADKIKIELPEIFFGSSRAQHGAVYRLRDSSLYSEKAAQQAIRLLQKGILFDHNYQLEDTTTMYCTEFVWYIYQLSGKDITFGKRSKLENVPLYSGTYIFPSDIYTNSDFQLIYKF